MASDYTVGYGKPPLHTRFQKGRSGNPGGRPRQGTIAAVLGDALDQRVPNPATGRRGRLTRREALVAQLLDRCADNDLRAMKLLLDLLVKLEPRPPREWSPPESDPAEDAREVLKRELARLAARMKEGASEGE